MFRSAFVFQKIRKNCAGCQPLENGGHAVRRVTSQELHSSNVQKKGHFSKICIFVWEVLKNYLSRKPGFLLYF